MNTGPDKFSSGLVPIPDRTTSGTVLYRIPVRYYRSDYRTGIALNVSGISEIFKVGASKYTKVPLEKRVQFQKTAFYVLIRTSLYLLFYLEK